MSTLDRINWFENNSPATDRVIAALEAPTTINAIEAPLNYVLEDLADQHGISIVSDLPLKNHPVTMTENGISLRLVLNQILNPLDRVQFIIRHESIIVGNRVRY